MECCVLSGRYMVGRAWSPEYCSTWIPFARWVIVKYSHNGGYLNITGIKYYEDVSNSDIGRIALQRGSK